MVRDVLLIAGTWLTTSVIVSVGAGQLLHHLDRDASLERYHQVGMALSRQEQHVA